MKRHWVWILLVLLLLGGGAAWILIWGSGTELWMETGVTAPEDSTGRSAEGEGQPAGKEVERAPGERVSNAGGEADRVSDTGPGFGIEGKVVDVLGKGMPGVAVSVCALNVLLVDGPGDAKLVTVESDAEGGFRIEKVWGERQYLFAETEQGDFGTLFLNKSPQGGWIRDVTVVVYEGQVARGRVLDQQGKAIEGAWILPVPVLDTRYRYWQMREQRSDAQGRFQVGGLPPGGFRLSVWAPGYRLGLTKIERDDMSEPVEIHLERGTAIEQSCRIQAEPKVLARIMERSPRVQIRGIRHDGERWALPSPFTGLRFAEDGTCRFQGLRSGKINARFEASGELIRSVFLHGELKEGEVPAEMVWKPALRLPLEARLVDEIDRPLEGIEVSTYRDSGSRIVRSDKEGVIRIPEFSPEGVLNYVELETPGWYFETQRGFKTMKAVGPGLNQVIKLFRGPSLAGQVLRADGTPAAGAEVVLLPDDVRTREVLGVAESDAEGRFRITPHWPKQPRQVRLTATLDKTLAIQSEALQLHKASRVEGVVLRLQAGARLSGRLVHEDRRPAGGQSLHLQPVKVDWLQLWSWVGGVTMSDSNGNFAFEGVPTGTWKLTIRKGEVYLDNEPLWVEVSVGSRMELGLLTLKSGLAVAGQILDMDGNALEGPPRLTVSRSIREGSSRPRLFMRGTQLAGDGTFRVTGLSPGTYDFVVHWAGSSGPSQEVAREASLPGLDRLAPFQTQVVAGQTDLDIRVPRPGFGGLEVSFRSGSDAWLPAAVHLSLQDPARVWDGGAKRMPVKNGVVSLGGIRSGIYRLRIRHPQFGRLDQQVVIERRKTAKAVVDLEGLTGRIEVGVVDDQGKAIAGAWVGLLPLIDNQTEIDDPWGIYWPPSRYLQAGSLSDAQGLARLRIAPAAQGLVVAWKPGFVPFARRVAGVTGPIRATLRTGSKVRFAIGTKTLGTTSKEAPWGMTLRCLNSEVADRDPRLEKGVRFSLHGSRPHVLEALPPGRYVLQGLRPRAKQTPFKAREVAIRREFELQAGKPLDVDL